MTVAGEDAIADTAATVDVQFASGATATGRFDLDDAMPLSVQQEKLRGKAASLIGAPAADGLWQVISELQNRTVAEFAAALAGTPGR